MDPEKAEKVVSLYTLFFKKTTWQQRLRALLVALKSIKNEVELEGIEETEGSGDETPSDATEDDLTLSMLQHFLM